MSILSIPYSSCFFFFHVVFPASVLSIKASKIKNRLLELHEDKRLDPPLNSNEEKDLKAFTASESWSRKIAAEFGWKSVTLHGEAGKVDAEAVKDEMDELRALIATYKPENVYNMDETGLLYKCLPNRSYVKESEVKTARGTSFMMNDKNRTTLYVTSNADGSDFVPLSIIGKSKNPLCFRGRVKKLIYYDQKKAWSDTTVFKQWWNDFLSHIRRKTNEPVLLILDNCGPHGAECVDNRGQVKVVFLPPNVTSVYQPMDAGVISMIKRRYRYRLLAKYLEIFEDRQLRREQAQAANMTRGTMGLEEGFPPHLRDAMDILDEVQNEDVTAIKLFNCWKKSTLLDAYVNYPHPNPTAPPAAAAPAAANDAAATNDDAVASPAAANDVAATNNDVVASPAAATNDEAANNAEATNDEAAAAPPLAAANAAAAAEPMDIDESNDDDEEAADNAEIVEGILKLVSLVEEDRKKKGVTEFNEMEHMFDELVVTAKDHGQDEDAMKDMLEGWVSMETTELIVDEQRRQVEKLMDDDALCGIAVEEPDDEEEDDDAVIPQEPFTDEDINKMTEQIKSYATYLQTRDCNGAFDKDVVALMDTANSIQRTKKNLNDNRIKKKQRSGRQSGMFPFVVLRKDDDEAQS